MTPPNLVLFAFPGYGPDTSRGVAARTSDGRVLLAEAAGNPGTSITNAIETAVPMALRAVGVDESDDVEVFQWTPDDPAKPNSLWRITFEDAEPIWEAADWEDDPVLAETIQALCLATGSNELE